MSENAANNIKQRLINHIEVIYPNLDANELAQQIIETFWPKTGGKKAIETHMPARESWSEETALLITYGDTIKQQDGTPPLQTLHKFLNTQLKDSLSGVHILPFFPYTSDDGFAVQDYYEVRQDLGDWNDIKAIAEDFSFMSDLVINHASASNEWFLKYLDGDEDYADYFYSAPKDTDTSMVVRPRPFPLLTPFKSHNGEKHVWCTFGPDQVDFNFSNPKVLLQFIDIMRVYMNNGTRIFRLDAVAFLWKEIGSSSIHLTQTHEVIRLLRTLVDHYDEDILLITETNVPNHENLSYFGNQNEAHLIYNFSLPPLLIQALLTGNEYYLKKWLMEMPPTQQGCAYLNFVASHDGVGLRPAQGILLEEDFTEMMYTIQKFGGEISMRRAEDGSEKPYEMNCSLYDALKGTIKGEDEFQTERFLASQCIMMALEGVPAFYIHSLLATPNAHERYKKTGHKRSINRDQYDFEELIAQLNDPQNVKSYIFNELKRLLKIRRAQAAFHPNATQFTLQLPEGLFGFWRQDLKREQNIFCITNLTDKEKDFSLHNLNLYNGPLWRDLITGASYEGRDHDIILRPYQTMWITNR